MNFDRYIYTVTLSRWRTFPVTQKDYLHGIVCNKENWDQLKCRVGDSLNKYL